MIRRKPLSRSRKPIRRSRASRGGQPSDVTARDIARLKQHQAEVYGAEYGSVFLRELFKQRGCPICDRVRFPAHQHHVTPRSRLGKAEQSICLCYVCHRRGHDIGWTSLLASHGLPPDHMEIACTAAVAEAMLAGYLPVELCEECKTWHSRKFMLWEVQEDEEGEGLTGQHLFFEPGVAQLGLLAGRVRRICTKCAPEGPP